MANLSGTLGGRAGRAVIGSTGRVDLLGGTVTLSIGQTLHNRYRIARLVGQGGFGAVYRAWDLALEQPVALKENTQDGSTTQRQFEREAKLLAGLRHPNLPRVIDHFIIPGQGQYLVMDFVEGRSLAALLRERGAPFEEADAVKWVRQVSDALTYLHTRTPPVIHRDIKPDNIILNNDGRAMLVDFGISKIFDESKGTTTGAQAVTHGYSPLEQYGRGKTDARSDVYSLGATLYTLLTGMVPPDAPDLVNGTETLLPPHHANRALSKTTSAAIIAAMAPSISQRIGSAAGFEQLLPDTTMPPSRGTVISPMTGAPYTELPDTPPSTPLSNPIPSPAGSEAQHEPTNTKGKSGVPVWGCLVGVLALAALALAALAVWAGLTFGGQNGGAAETTPEATDALVIAEADTLRLTPTAEPQAGELRIVLRGGVEAELVFVPAGSFMMGSEDGRPDELPVHEVTLDAFWLDRTEVTNAQFSRCVADGGCQRPSDNSSYTHSSYYSNAEFADYPVIAVTWYQASDLCKWAGGRLPTEAEWEYAARGPESFIYPWSNNQPTPGLLNFDSNVGDMSEVGSYPSGASWVGALDMAGNVWEWVNDWYDAGYYEDSPGENPQGPVSVESRVMRGGDLSSSDFDTRSSARHYEPPVIGYSNVGFRCAQE